MDFLEPSISRIFAGVIFLLLVAVITMIGKRADASLDPTRKAIVMRYSVVYRVVGLILLIIPVAAIISLVFEPAKEKEMGELLAAGIAAVVFSILSGFILLETTCKNILVSKQGIESISPWRAPRYIAWDDVTRVRSLNNAYLFVIHADDGTKIAISLYFAGLAEFAATLKQRLPPASYTEAQRGIRKAEGRQ